MEKSNEIALKIVEQQYASFINQQNSWNFFRGLAEYTKTIQEMVQTKPLIDALEKQAETAKKVYELMSSNAIKEFTKSAQRLLPIVEGVLKQQEPLIKQSQELAEKYKPVIGAVQEVQDRIAGRILSSNPLSAFDSDLFDVARHMKASGHEEDVKEFENNKKRNHNVYGNYTFSPTYEKIDEEERMLKRKAEVEAWGAWEQLPLVKILVYEPEKAKADFKKEADKDPKTASYWAWINFSGLCGEMEKIRTGEKPVGVIFKIDSYKGYAQRVHTFITTELIKADTKTKLDFDDKHSILYFANEEIKISERADSDAHDLLRTLFKDKFKLWDNDVILDDWKIDYDNKRIPKNKVYQAGKAVNRIIAQETKIKDFLVLTTKTVLINKKYLNK